MSWRLALVGFLTSALVAAVYVWTAPAIKAAREYARQALLREVAAPLLVDAQFGPPFSVAWSADAPQALTHQTQVTPLLKQAQQVGLVVHLRTDAGYSGAIELLMAVDLTGRIAGVRTLSHRETPGLGDGIELKHSDWILAFDGLAYADLAASDWAVKKDGGRFDSFTGATITPRAVVDAVAAAADYLATKPPEVLYAR